MERREWLETYRVAWVGRDPDLAASLFTETGTYQSFIFDEPHVGHDGVRAYWTGATADQSDIEVILGTPMDDGEHVAVEWWTQMDVDGEPMTLVGTLLLTFAPDGRCRRLREYYHHIPQRKAPPPGWGSWD